MTFCRIRYFAALPGIALIGIISVYVGAHVVVGAESEGSEVVPGGLMGREAEASIGLAKKSPLALSGVVQMSGMGFGSIRVELARSKPPLARLDGEEVASNRYYGLSSESSLTAASPGGRFVLESASSLGTHLWVSASGLPPIVVPLSQFFREGVIDYAVNEIFAQPISVSLPEGFQASQITLATESLGSTSTSGYLLTGTRTYGRLDKNAMGLILCRFGEASLVRFLVPSSGKGDSNNLVGGGETRFLPLVIPARSRGTELPSLIKVSMAVQEPIVVRGTVQNPAIQGGFCEAILEGSSSFVVAKGEVRPGGDFEVQVRQEGSYIIKASVYVHHPSYSEAAIRVQVVQGINSIYLTSPQF